MPAPLGARANSTLFSRTSFLQLASVPTLNGGWTLTLWCFPISEFPRPSFGVGLRIFAEWMDFATQKLTSKPGTVIPGVSQPGITQTKGILGSGQPNPGSATIKEGIGIQPLFGAPTIRLRAAGMPYECRENVTLCVLTGIQTTHVLCFTIQNPGITERHHLNCLAGSWVLRQFRTRPCRRGRTFKPVTDALGRSWGVYINEVRNRRSFFTG